MLRTTLWAKKVSGIKRTIAVDTQGLPHVIAVDIANITDRKAATQAFETNKDDLKEVEAVLTDCGYTGESFANSIWESIDAKVKLAKRRGAVLIGSNADA